MKHFFILLASVMLACCSSDNEMMAGNAASANNGKTLVVYYSYTGDCRRIADELRSQLLTDVVEVTPKDKTQKYEANNYAIGTQLLNAIQSNPDNADSYPEIDPVNVNLEVYENVIIVTPLWWSQMAAIMQTFLFQNAQALAHKNVALVVSSHSSSISGVVRDAKRLLPDASWMGDALWINNSNRSNTASLVAEWMAKLNFKSSSDNMAMNITIGGVTKSVDLVENAATVALLEKLKAGPVNIRLNTNGDFEIWGSLGFSLPTANEYINGQPGDVVLYNGSNICIFYGENSYSYTRLGKINGISADELKSFLKGGQDNISVTLSLPGGTTAVNRLKTTGEKETYFSISGQRVEHPANGIFIKNGKKIRL